MPSAIVLINTDPGGEQEVFDKLVTLDEVAEIDIVYGVYDLVVKIQTSDTDKLKSFVTNTIRKLPKVRSTLTMVIMEGKSLVKK